MIARFTSFPLAGGFLLATFVAAAKADDAQTLARIDEQIVRIKTFEFGAGDGPARDLERTVFQLPIDSPLRKTIERKLIDALEDSNSLGRGVICRQLRVIGTDRCISAVAKLLEDPEVSPFARYTLQGIGSDDALEAMHDALADVSIYFLRENQPRRAGPSIVTCFSPKSAST